MKKYNKIPYFNKGLYNQPVIAFDKLDGSNIRFEWSHKRGWYKFGTRNVMIDIKDENFGKSIPIFLNKYGDALARIFVSKYKKIENFVVFGEYVGENSFAGYHDPKDKMDIVLFDINQYKRGFIPATEFVKNFSALDIPKIIYEGKYTPELIESIKRNDYNLSEGVIAKGLLQTKNQKDEVWMVKIKTEEWLKKVKTKFGEAALLKELNNDKTLMI